MTHKDLPKTNTYTISVFPDGSIQHTLKDAVLHTGFIGKRKVERMSEILFNEDTQKFFIRWIQGPLQGQDTYIRGFYSYESAVACEVEIIETLRKDLFLKIT